MCEQVVERGMYHCENAYKIPNVRVTGYVCKTNIPSNTAFRGFGGPQGMMMAEQMITDVALTLGISVTKVIRFFIWTAFFNIFNCLSIIFYDQNARKTMSLTLLITQLCTFLHLFKQSRETSSQCIYICYLLMK